MNKEHIIAQAKTFLLDARSAVVDYLTAVAAMCGPDENDPNEIDVRLRVLVGPEGVSWAATYGDASFDQDHRGYWGSSSVFHEDDPAALRAVADDLISQCLEQMWSES